MSSFQPIACSFAIPHSDQVNSTGLRERQISIPDVSTIPFIHNARLEELLNSNVPPEHADLHFLNVSLESARSVSARLQQGILVLQKSLEQMQNANTSLMSAIAEHQAIIGPLRSLPDDILLTIFRWCTSSDRKGIDCLSSSRAPWTLSHVCHRWRTLVVASPSLWSNIEIISRDLDTSTPYEKDALSFKVGLYAGRSAECDLSVIIIGYLDIDAHTAFLDECFTPLLPTAHRWKRLLLMIHHIAHAARVAKCRFDRLTKMRIHFGDILARSVYSTTWDVPSIRELSLSTRPSAAVNFPWGRITSYTCDEYGICHLPKLVALEHFSLPAFTSDQLASLSMSFPLVLSNVRSISVEQARRKYLPLDRLSNLFLLPSLTTLAVTIKSGHWRFPTFNGCIRHVQNLSIVANIGRSLLDSDKEELRSFLARCTSVGAFYLETEIAHQGILQVLADVGTFPLLTSLRISGNLMLNCPECVINIVESRCQGINVAPLTELMIVEMDGRMRKGKWMEGLRVTGDVLERWSKVCNKVNVLTVSENCFQ